MIGVRTGAKVGIRVGGAVGVGADPISSGVAVPTFVTSGAVKTGAAALDMSGASMPAHQAGDLLVLQVGNSDLTARVAATLSTPGNFTALAGGAIASGTFGGIFNFTTVFVCVAASGSETAPVVAANGAFSAAIVHVFRGAAASGAIEAVQTTADNSGDLTLSMAGVTTLGANRLVVGLCTAFTSGLPATLGSLANADLTDFQTRFSAAQLVGGEDLYMVAITGTRAAQGAVGATTGTWADATNVVSSAVVFAIKP